jgi:hypothetical protein
MNAVASRNVEFISHSDQGGCGDGVQIMVHRGYAYIGHGYSNGITVLDVRDLKNPSPSRSCLARRTPVPSISRRMTICCSRSDAGRCAGLLLGIAVRYVLEGSVRRLGNQLRVNAQLIDAATDAHFWAERFDPPEGPPMADLGAGDPRLVRSHLFRRPAQGRNAGGVPGATRAWLSRAAPVPNTRSLWRALPRIDERHACPSDVAGITGNQCEPAGERRRCDQRIDHRESAAGRQLAPKPRGRRIHRQNPIGESRFDAVDPCTEASGCDRIGAPFGLDAFAQLPQRQDAQE